MADQSGNGTTSPRAGPVNRPALPTMWFSTSRPLQPTQGESRRSSSGVACSTRAVTAAVTWRSWSSWVVVVSVVVMGHRLLGVVVGGSTGGGARAAKVMSLDRRLRTVGLRELCARKGCERAGGSELVEGGDRVRIPEELG